MSHQRERPEASFWRGKRVLITGGHGFLGGTVSGMLNQLGASLILPRSYEIDLRYPNQARRALEGAEIVFHLAANVGGIGYNQEHPAPLLRDNALLALSVMDAAQELGVQKIVSAGSVCAYPNLTPTPFQEENLWNGYPEKTNAPYGIAKRLAHELTATYRRQYGLNAVMPILANLYGPGDNFDPNNSHVIPALIRKFVFAQDESLNNVQLWGTGNASREFLYVDDAARALILSAERLETSDPVNIGTSRETTIREVAETIAELTGFSGDLIWDTTRPDGQPQRVLDTSAACDFLGFEPEVSLEEGLELTINYWQSVKTEQPKRS